MTLGLGGDYCMSEIKDITDNTMLRVNSTYSRVELLGVVLVPANDMLIWGWHTHNGRCGELRTEMDLC